MLTATNKYSCFKLYLTHICHIYINFTELYKFPFKISEDIRCSAGDIFLTDFPISRNAFTSHPSRAKNVASQWHRNLLSIPQILI